MVNWVRRFLTSTPPVASATAEECRGAYLRTLEAERHEDWQVEQARMAGAKEKQGGRFKLGNNAEHRTFNPEGSILLILLILSKNRTR